MNTRRKKQNSTTRKTNDSTKPPVYVPPELDKNLAEDCVKCCPLCNVEVFEHRVHLAKHLATCRNRIKCPFCFQGFKLIDDLICHLYEPSCSGCKLKSTDVLAAAEGSNTITQQVCDIIKENEKCVHYHIGTEGPLLLSTICLKCQQVVTDPELKHVCLNEQENIQIVEIKPEKIPEVVVENESVIVQTEVFKSENTEVTDVKKRTKGTSKANVCSICDKVFSNRGNLSRHKTLYHKEPRFACDQCNEKFATTDLVKRHKRKAHTLERPFKCTICQKAFVVPEVLRKHMKLHLGCKKYLCTYCGKAFPDTFHLKEHERVHTHETPYQCDKCGKFCHTQSGFTKHRGNCGALTKRQLQRNLEAALNSYSDESKTFYCIECEVPLVFDTKSALRDHCKVVHGKSSVCSVCNQKFGTYSAMWQHTLHAHVSGDERMCTICGMKLKNRIKLWEHMRRKHHRPYACSICSRRFGSRRHVHNHMILHDENKFKHKCHVCGGEFQQIHTFNEHVKSHETEESTFLADPVVTEPTEISNIQYQCTECQKLFRTQERLWSHRQTHSKPFTCTVCDRNFAYANALREHLAVHAENVEEIPLPVISEEIPEITETEVIVPDFSNLFLQPLTCIISKDFEADAETEVLATFEFLDQVPNDLIVTGVDTEDNK